ncbi:uncharacterized protein F5147DRAFT_727530 [Suillus discolor]|uniref:Uncharacterized protein n=1 Tax=Suillus discolor TaxID=1912936 RepID=A0A9P7ETQ9_9AGAM|nr:uncharacterized protein F5147DRAFT_727530 [Suillus discolor]KAG2087686.1 hypothetical protein F5147DRAFT_727530 [Suillus discolor]
MTAAYRYVSFGLLRYSKLFLFLSYFLLLYYDSTRLSQRGPLCGSLVLIFALCYFFFNSMMPNIT